MGNKGFDFELINYLFINYNPFEQFMKELGQKKFALEKENTILNNITGTSFYAMCVCCTMMSNLSL